GVYEFHRLDINVESPFDSSPATLAHTPPVFEAVGDKVVGGNCRYCLVPVPHLDCIKVYGNHISVCIELGHFHPISHAYHVIRRDLDTRHKTDNSVLEDQHNDSGHRPEGAEEVNRRFAEKQGKNQYPGRDINEDPDQLKVTCYWLRCQYRRARHREFNNPRQGNHDAHADENQIDIGKTNYPREESVEILEQNRR